MIFRGLPTRPLALQILALALILGPSTAGANPPEAAARQYNEACRLSLSGDQPAALESFRQAMAGGFDDLEFALNDPDLASLQQEKGFQDLITARQSTLQLMSSEKGHALTSGQWCPSFPLEIVRNATPGAPPPVMQLRWQPSGLDFELHLQGAWTHLAGEKVPAPWKGGPGLILTLGVPEAAATYQTSSHFLLAFGLEKSSPVGAIYLDRGGWQRILELDPTVRIENRGETMVLSGSLPWQSIQPFHPLVDPRLGFNAALRVPTATGFARAELFPDPKAFLPESPLRRYVPLDFEIATEAQESVAGKVDQSISYGGPLELTLMAISSQEGVGNLTLDFTDNQQKSLLPGGAFQSKVNLTQGPNQLEQPADFSALKPGLYVVRAELGFPSGHRAIWSTMVLQLGENWRDRFASRVENLPPEERRTGQYYLRAVESALQESRPRFNPGPIATTLNDLGRILARAERTGTILPDSGTMLLVVPGPDDQDRLMTLYLPKGYRQRGEPNPVLVALKAPGLEASLVQRVDRSYKDPEHLGPDRQTTPTSPIYIIPHFETYQRDIQDMALAEITTALEWSLNYFSAEQASVCGVDFYGGSALRLTLQQPDRIRGLQIMAGGRFDPWPQANKEFLANQLEPAPPRVPVTWLDFSQETEVNGQGPLIFEVLRQLGYRLEPVQTVRGGLSISQIADRVVLWAESLP